MKKSNIIIGIGAILWMIFVALNRNFRILIDFGLGFVPLIIIAVGIVVRLFRKEYSLAQKIFAWAYFVLLVVQIVLVVFLQTRIIYKITNNMIFGVTTIIGRSLPSVLAFLPLGGLFLFDKDWSSKVSGFLILASWSLCFIKGVSILGMTTLHPLFPHIYKATKYITESPGRENLKYIMLMDFMSVVAGMAILIWAILGMQKKRKTQGTVL